MLSRIRELWTKALLGVLLGAAAGFLAYQAVRLPRPWLFAVCGALAGLLVVVVVFGYRRSVRLTDITVSVPQFSRLRFAVTRDGQDVAWKLFVEASTRIATQPVADGSGRVREALTSLYSLFAVIRDLLKDSQPSRQGGTDPAVEHLAIAMLNLELRPFLARWHPALHDWEQANKGRPESAWPDDAACRAELADLQKRLVGYVLSFGKLAGLSNAAEVLTAGVPGPAKIGA